jgi:hypothetical protein
MFIRTKVFKNKNGSTRTYLQLAESYRDGKKNRQRVLLNLGRLEELQEGQIDRLIEQLARFSQEQWNKANMTENADVRWTKQWGPEIIFRHLWQQLGLGDMLNDFLHRLGIKVPLEEAIYAMVLNRLCDPQSKLGVSQWVKSVHRPEFEQLQLHHFYAGLDVLAEHKDQIEVQLFDRVRDLFNIDLDLVFWDTTSTYFEGSGPGDLAHYGYSKDKRADRLQIMVGILMTKEGIPVAHQIFPGNTNDVNTFKAALEDLRTRFKINRVIMVGDRGMVSKKVLKDIQDAGLEYIVGVRMRRMRDVSTMLSWKARYINIKPTLRVKEVKVQDRARYILCYNPEAAKRDRLAREAILAKLEAKLITGGGFKSLVGNRGYRRYIKVEGQAQIIDQKALKREARFDGKFLLCTNSKLPTDQVAIAYKELWRIERAFRELKSGLDLRPIYHWKDSRVRGHIMVCFLALVLESTLIKKLSDIGSKARYREVMRDLAQLNAVQVTILDKDYLCRPELVGSAYEAFRATGIRPPLKMAEL